MRILLFYIFDRLSKSSSSFSSDGSMRLYACFVHHSFHFLYFIYIGFLGPSLNPLASLPVLTLLPQTTTTTSKKCVFVLMESSRGLSRVRNFSLRFVKFFSTKKDRYIIIILDEDARLSACKTQRKTEAGKWTYGVHMCVRWSERLSRKTLQKVLSLYNAGCVVGKVNKWNYFRWIFLLFFFNSQKLIRLKAE